MTAVIERAFDLAPSIGSESELNELRRALDEQKQVLGEQTLMLRALDARREQLDELVADLMPIANDAMLLAIAKLDAVGQSGAKAWLTEMTRELNAVRQAPAPGWRDLLRRVRDPDTRKGLALLLTAVRALGRVAVPPAGRNGSSR